MRLSRFAMAMLLVVSVAACESDKPGPVAPTEPQPTPRVVDVFPDFETAFNERDAATYARILDDDFVFRPSDLDVASKGMPTVWDRADEMEYMAKLLDRGNQVPIRCDSVYLDFNYPRFIELHRFHPPAAPDETWYRTTLSFDFEFQFAALTIVSAPGNRATFVIRNDGTDAMPVWKIVEMQDLGPPDTSLAAAVNDPLTWTLGAIKALYRPLE